MNGWVPRGLQQTLDLLSFSEVAIAGYLLQEPCESLLADYFVFAGRHSALGVILGIRGSARAIPATHPVTWGSP